MAVKQAAKDSPLDTGRAIEGFYHHRFLCRVFSGSACGFVLKGGQSVLARTIDARYSRDVDLSTNADDLSEAVGLLLRLASNDLDDFVSFELAETRDLRLESAGKQGMKLIFEAFLGARKMTRVSVDLVADYVPDELAEWIEPADRISVKGLPVCEYRVVPIEYALVDKLLGIMTPHSGRPSSRVKDLVDIVLYLSSYDVDGTLMAGRLEQEAKERTFPHPLEFEVPSIWHESYQHIYGKLSKDAHVREAARTLEEGGRLAKQFYDPLLRGEGGGLMWRSASRSWEALPDRR